MSFSNPLIPSVQQGQTTAFVFHILRHCRETGLVARVKETERVISFWREFDRLHSEKKSNKKYS